MFFLYSAKGSVCVILSINYCCRVLETEYLCTTQIHMLKPNLLYDGIRRWGLCKVLRVELSWMGLVLLIKCPRSHSPLHLHVRTQPEVGLLHTRSGLSPDTESACTWILDCLPPKLWEISAYWLSHPVFGISIVAVQRHWEARFCVPSPFILGLALLPLSDPSNIIHLKPC